MGVVRLWFANNRYSARKKTMIKIGDVVRLKGTSMKMTVESLLADFAIVIWFDREDEFNRYIFSVDRLELV